MDFAIDQICSKWIVFFLRQHFFRNNSVKHNPCGWAFPHQKCVNKLSFFREHPHQSRHGNYHCHFDFFLPQDFTFIVISFLSSFLLFLSLLSLFLNHHCYYYCHHHFLWSFLVLSLIIHMISISCRLLKKLSASVSQSFVYFLPGMDLSGNVVHPDRPEKRVSSKSFVFMHEVCVISITGK